MGPSGGAACVGDEPDLRVPGLVTRSTSNVGGALYDSAMSDTHDQRLVEIGHEYIGETPPPALATKQMIACLSGNEAVLVCLPAKAVGQDGVAAITATRIIFAPFDPDLGAVTWQRGTLCEAKIADSKADWKQIWRIGWPPGSEVKLTYASGRNVTLTAPSTSSTSREFGDRYAAVLADLLTDG